MITCDDCLHCTPTPDRKSDWGICEIINDWTLLDDPALTEECDDFESRHHEQD